MPADSDLTLALLTAPRFVRGAPGWVSIGNLASRIMVFDGQMGAIFPDREVGILAGDGRTWRGVTYTGRAWRRRLAEAIDRDITAALEAPNAR